MKLLFLLFLLQDPSSWVEKLASGSDSVRWEAVENLSHLGAEGQEVIGACPDEWWRTIALAEWTSRRMAGKNYPEPLRLKLDFSNGEAARIAVQLAEKAGIDLQRRTFVAGEVSLDLKEGTWFELLGELGRKAELDIVESTGGEYRIVPGNSGFSFSSLSRNYEIRLLSLIRSTQATFDAPPRAQTSLKLAIRSNPGSPILEVKEGRLIKGTLNSGQELRMKKLVQTSRGSYGRYRDLSSQSFEIAVEPFDPAEKKISSLRGSVQIVLPAKVVSFKIRPRFDGKKTRVEKGGVTVVVKKISHRNRRVELALSIQSDLSGTVFPKEDRIRVVDEVGLPYRSWRRSSKSVGELEMEYQISYQNTSNLGDPRAIELSVVTETYERPVYFSFQEVDLE